MPHYDEGTLQAWLDGPRSGMDAEARAAVAAHVERCARCSRLVDELRDTGVRVDALLDDGATDAAPPPFADVAARSGARGTAPSGGTPPARAGRSPWRSARWVAGLAAAVMAGWFSRDLYRRGPSPTGGEPVEAPAATRQALPSVEVRPETPAADADRAADRRTVETPPVASSGSGAPAVAEAPSRPTRAEDAAGRTDAARSREAQAAVRSKSEDATTRPPPSPAPPPEERLAREASAPAARPEPPSVVGRVTDADGRPLSGAQVTVRGRNVGSLTDVDGGFTLPLGPATPTPEDSTLTVVVDLIGYRQALVELRPSDPGALRADVRLEQASIALDEIVVAGAAAPTEARPRVDVRPGDAAWGAGWTPMERAAAEADVGFALLTVPELPVRSIEVGRVDGVPVVRVRQVSARGRTVTLLQARADLFTARAPDGTGVVADRRGEISIVAFSDEEDTALRALLDRLR